MPIYEYKCQSCGTVFEELVSHGHSAPLPCPQCSSGETRKLMSRTGKVGSSQNEVACAPSCPGAHACAGGGGCQFS